MAFGFRVNPGANGYIQAMEFKLKYAGVGHSQHGDPLGCREDAEGGCGLPAIAKAGPW